MAANGRAGVEEGDGGSEDGSEENDGLQVVQRFPPTFLFEEPPVTVKPPLEEFPQDPTVSPAPGFEWRGNGPPGSPRGNWYNPETGEYLRPDMDHPLPKGPHWDYRDPDGNEYRWYPGGGMEPKIVA